MCVYTCGRILPVLCPLCPPTVSSLLVDESLVLRYPTRVGVPHHDPYVHLRLPLPVEDRDKAQILVNVTFSVTLETPVSSVICEETDRQEYFSEKDRVKTKGETAKVKDGTRGFSGAESRGSKCMSSFCQRERDVSVGYRT